MITTVIVYPRKTVVQVFLAAGDLNEIKGLFDTIVAWGASLGVSTFLMTGRMGWVKALKEYGARVQATMILEV
jgi:hypothetical protein